MPKRRENRPKLTLRQRQVGELLATGLTVAQVAEQMSISPITVRQHIAAAAARIQGPGTPSYRLLRWALFDKLAGED